MKSKKTLVFLMVILSGLNLGLFKWNANLERDLKPQQIHYLDSINIHTMAFDAKDRLWAVSPSGIQVFQNEQLVNTYSGSQIEAVKEHLPYGENVRLYFDRQDNPWLIAEGHFYVLENEKWIEFGPDLIQIKGGISVISFDLQNRIWVGTYYDDGLFVIDGLSVTHYTAQSSKLAHNRIEDIAIDDAGKIWIATWGGGINIVNGNEWQTLDMLNSPLASNYVHAIAFDRENQVWIGTSDGFHVLDGQNWKTYTQKTSPISQGEANNFAFTRSGRVWIGLSAMILTNGKWEYYFIPTKPFEDVWVSKVFDSQGNMYMLSQFTAQTKVTFVSADSRLASAFDVFLSFMVVSGGIIFISVLLIELWLASFLKAGKALWISLGMTLLAGIFFFWFWTTATRSIIQMHYETQIFFIGNPGFVTALTVTTSTLIAKSINRSNKAEDMGLIIGWIIGVPLGVTALIYATIFMMGPM